MGFENLGPEWHIKNLKLSIIFEYEFEQVFTNILFQLLTIKRAIERHQPDDITFIETNQGCSNSNNSYLEIFSGLKLSEFFENLNIPCYSINNTSEEISDSDNILIKLSKINTVPVKVRRRLLRLVNRGYFNKLTFGNIIISNSDRCLHKLVDHPEYKRKIAIIKDKEVQSIKKASKSLPLKFNEMFFEDVSLNPFFRKWLIYTEGRFNYLKLLFNETIELINRHSPLVYITVNIANSTEIVKMWAYYTNNVRTVFACEGLGQPNDKLDIVIDSVLHTGLGIERWVASRNFAQKFGRNKNPVHISGYLDRSITNIYETKKIPTLPKNITFALSMVHPVLRRAIVGEDMFEMLKSIKSVSSVISCFPEYTLHLKLHPGDRKNIPLYKQQINKDSNFRVSMDESLNKIIDQSAIIIIYDTSVGLGSLLRRKNVICYNHTQRDTYTTAVYEYLNHDPAKGAAMLMATNEGELKECISKLLPYSNNNKPSPGLDYVLENARSDYNAADVVKDILK